MTYCHVDDAFNANQNNNDDLDKMARKVNDNKRKQNNDLYKSYRTNDGYHISARNESKSNQKINSSESESIPNARNDGSDRRHIDGFYTMQGDYLNNNPLIIANKGTKIKDLEIEKQIQDIHQNIYTGIVQSDGISLDTPSDADSDSFSSDEKHTISTDEIKDEVIAKSKYTKNYCGKNLVLNHQGTKIIEKRDRCYDFDLNSVDSLESLESGESLLEHARKCYDCKKRLMDLINLNKKKEKKTYNNRKNSVKKFDEKNKNNPFIPMKKMEHDNNELCDNELKIKKQKNMSEENYDYMELKNILIVCMIGFMIIILLDIIIRN